MIRETQTFDLPPARPTFAQLRVRLITKPRFAPLSQPGCAGPIRSPYSSAVGGAAVTAPLRMMALQLHPQLEPVEICAVGPALQLRLRATPTLLHLTTAPQMHWLACAACPVAPSVVARLRARATLAAAAAQLRLRRQDPVCTHVTLRRCELCDLASRELHRRAGPLCRHTALQPILMPLLLSLSWAEALVLALAAACGAAQPRLATVQLLVTVTVTVTSQRLELPHSQRPSLQQQFRDLLWATTRAGPLTQYQRGV